MWVYIIHIKILYLDYTGSKKVHLKIYDKCPDYYGSDGWMSLRKAKGLRFDSQSGHRPGLRVQSQLGYVQVAID